jgi:hypothetical protein
MPQTIRIRPETRRQLELIAQSESTTMTRLLDKMVDAYRRQRFLHATNAAFAALRRHPKLWEQELHERQEWDATLNDGIKDEV